MADGLGSSVSLLVPTLSGSTITSSRYQTRQAAPPLGQRSLVDTSRADRVYLVRENFLGCVIHSSSDLREDVIDGSSVLVSFVLVRPPLFRDGTSDTTSNKEQVLATVVPTVAIRRCVSIHVGPLFFITPSEPPNSIFFSYILKAGT